MLPLVLLSVFLLASGSATADARADFLAAEQALTRGDVVLYSRLAAGLRDYPLYPYLRFAELSQDLGRASDLDVQAFLDAYSDSHLAARLRVAYLKRLASAGRWADYRRFYRPDDSVERQCLSLRALIATGERAAALAQVEPIWLSGEVRPSACEPLFAAWQADGGLTPALMWQRIRLALEGRRPELARQIGERLPAETQAALKGWLALYKDPRRMLDPGAVPAEPGQRAGLLAVVIARLAPKEPGRAAEVLERYAEALRTDAAAGDLAHAALGAALTDAGARSGLDLWDGVRPIEANLREQERRLRAAIRLRDWDWVARWVAVMPDGMAKQDRWLYWLGRAQEQRGQAEEAQAALGLAAARRSLWGFLAAERLGRPLALGHSPIPAAPERIRALATGEAFKRLRELSRLGRETDLRREWRALTAGMEAADLMAAAYLADAMRWHDQAVFTQARADHWDDLELRFPLGYQELILDQSWQTGIEPDWVLAVLRQESVFARTAASPAGALGLMQLMPKTAASVGQALGLAPLSRRELLEPQTNITLGATYLAELRDRFGHPLLATAAYNAGPTAVSRWLPRECTEADLWILDIPYAETRAYVERVMTYRVIYRARLGQEQEPLRDWMRPIAPIQRRAAGPVALGSESGD